MKELQSEAVLFERVVTILEEARANVVRSVNTSMVTAYWLIGREIVQVTQSGEDRAEYGKQVLEGLSSQLQIRFKNGFSVPNLQNFRKFYQSYPDRLSIRHPSGGELRFGSEPSEIQYPTGTKSESLPIQHPPGGESGGLPILSPTGRESGFHPHLGWSHYRALMRVDDAAALHESTLEQAIIDNLQAFLLELGKGFSFVARQRHIRFEDDDFYVDLVFYNYLLKCFLLIDLKIGKLTHRDIGQMDGYVRLFEDRFKVEGDNPTIGLILCSDKSEAVAKYSVLSEGRQIFASKYLQFLPSEQELMREIEKERKVIEATLAEKSGWGMSSSVRRNLGGGSFPLAANVARFPLPPLRGAAPRNAQRGRVRGRFNTGRLVLNRIGKEL